MEKDQMSLFGVLNVTPEKESTQDTTVAKPGERSLRRNKAGQSAIVQAGRNPRAGKERDAKGRRKKAPKALAKTYAAGLVPAGDVRLTINIRQDLHLRLKIAAAHERTTIGEIIEELVEQYVRQ